MPFRNLNPDSRLMKIGSSLAAWISSITWLPLYALVNHGIYYSLVEEDHDKIRALLKENYFIALTRRKAHLTTYLIALGSFFMFKKFDHYTHAFMNVEGDITNNMDYKIIEATAIGVHFSTFMQVFDCDSVVFLKPRGLPIDAWTMVLDVVKKEYGKQYDTLFDITDEERVSCVEMIYQGLRKLPAYDIHFPQLAALLRANDNILTPQALYDCGDLEIVFEVRR